MTLFQIMAVGVSVIAVILCAIDSYRRPSITLAPVKHQPVPPAPVADVIPIEVIESIAPKKLSLQESIGLVCRIRDEHKDPDVTSHCNELIKALLGIAP